MNIRNKNCEYCKKTFTPDNFHTYFSIRIKEGQRMYLCPKCKSNDSIVIRKDHAMNRFRLRTFDFAHLKRDFNRWTTSGEELFLIKDILEISKRISRYLPESDIRRRSYLREQELFDIKRHERVMLLKIRERVKELVRELIVQCQLDPLYPTEKNIKIFTEKMVKDTAIQQFPVAMKIVDDVKIHHDSTQYTRDNKRKIDAVLKKELKDVFNDDNMKMKEVFDKIKTEPAYIDFHNRGGDPIPLVNRLMADVKKKQLIKIEDEKIESILKEIFENEDISDYLKDIDRFRKMLKPPMTIQDIATKMINCINKDKRVVEIKSRLYEKNVDVDMISYEMAYIHYVNGELRDLDWVVDKLEHIYWKTYREREIDPMIRKKFTGCRLEYVQNLSYYKDYIENGGNAQETFDKIKKDVDKILNRGNLSEKWKTWAKNNKMPACLKVDIDEFFCRSIEKKLFDLIDDDSNNIISIDNKSYRYSGYRFIEKRCNQLGLTTRRTLNNLEIIKKVK